MLFMKVVYSMNEYCDNIDIKLGNNKNFRRKGAIKKKFGRFNNIQSTDTKSSSPSHNYRDGSGRFDSLHVSESSPDFASSTNTVNPSVKSQTSTNTNILGIKSTQIRNGGIPRNRLDLLYLGRTDMKLFYSTSLSQKFNPILKIDGFDIIEIIRLLKIPVKTSEEYNKELGRTIKHKISMLRENLSKDLAVLICLISFEEKNENEDELAFKIKKVETIMQILYLSISSFDVKLEQEKRGDVFSEGLKSMELFFIEYKNSLCSEGAKLIFPNLSKLVESVEKTLLQTTL